MLGYIDHFLLLMLDSTHLQFSISRIKPIGFNPQVEVASCFICCNERFLLIKRAKDKPHGDTWCIPGGKKEIEETIQETALREVFEEVGVALVSDTLEYIGPLFFQRPGEEFVFHMFYQKFENFPEVNISSESQEHRWVTLEEVFKLPLIEGGAEVFFDLIAFKLIQNLPRKPFYFIRHGQTDVNADPATKRVDYDLPLNIKGREQAIAARRHVEILPLKTIFHSPIQRAQETKQILSEGIEVQYHVVHELSECKAAVWTDMVKFEKPLGSRPNGEAASFIIQTLHGVKTVLSHEGPSLIVAHGGTHWAICHSLMIENHPWRIGNCELVHFQPVGESDWKAEIIS